MVSIPMEIGEEHNGMVVIGDSGERTRLDSILWNAQCKRCDHIMTATRGNLVRGTVEDKCACVHTITPVNTTHGLAYTPEYWAWTAMKQSCSNPNNIRFMEYGARGVKVCKEWENSFMAFYRDMGERPGKKYRVDLIDRDGHFTPDNTEWVIRRKPREERTGVVQKPNGLWYAKLVTNDHGVLKLGHYKACEDAQSMLEWVSNHPLFDRYIRKKRGGTSSKYKGVCWLKGAQRWKAYHPRTGKSLGWHKTEERARMAVEAYCREVGEDL